MATPEKFQNSMLPARAKIMFGQNPDGSLSPLQLDATGKLSTTASGGGGGGGVSISGNTIWTADDGLFYVRVDNGDGTIIWQTMAGITTTAPGAGARPAGGTGFGVGAGTATAAGRVTLASDDPAVAVLGAVSGAKVITDANGTIQQYLRGLVTFFANAIGAGTAAAAIRHTLASDDPLVAAFGAKTDAKSTATDATSISAMQVLKQISASLQTPPSQAITSPDNGITTLGAKADNRSTSTDTTAITAMSILKQISFSVQAIATSIAGTVSTVLTAGSAIIGKVSAVDSGGTDATDTTNHALRVNVVAGSAAGATGAGTAAAAGRVTLASDDPAVATLGAVADAAVVTSASGTVSAKLRGIISLLVSGITVATHAVTQSGSWVLSAGSAVIGKTGSDLTTEGTTNRVAVGGLIAKASANFNRPADTNVYAAGDAVGSSTTGASVTPLDFTVSRAASGIGLNSKLLRARMRKTGASITTAEFRLHLYATTLTPSVGDNATPFTSSNVANYIGYIDFLFDRAFSDGAFALGVLPNNTPMNFFTQHVYGLVEAKSAYTPASAETLTFDLDVEQY